MSDGLFLLCKLVASATHDTSPSRNSSFAAIVCICVFERTGDVLLCFAEVHRVTGSSCFSQPLAPWKVLRHRLNAKPNLSANGKCIQMLIQFRFHRISFDSNGIHNRCELSAIANIPTNLNRKMPLTSFASFATFGWEWFIDYSLECRWICQNFNWLTGTDVFYHSDRWPFPSANRIGAHVDGPQPLKAFLLGRNLFQLQVENNEELKKKTAFLTAVVARQFTSQKNSCVGCQLILIWK